MSLPPKPAIDEAILCRCERPYAGPIEPGMVFAWEPDLPWARELCVVQALEEAPPPLEIRHATGVAIISRGSGLGVRTRDMDRLKPPTWNSMDRFREAVVPTMYNRMPL